MSEFCDAVEEPSQARCQKEPDHRGPHVGWAHYPGQLVSWSPVPSASEGDRT